MIPATHKQLISGADESTRRYKIQTLLDTAVQPFESLGEDEMTALAASIKTSIAKGRGLPDPISMTADGSEIVFDGSQRLTCLLHLGRVYIDAADVRQVEGATAKNALEWSIHFQVQRRNLTIEDKAKVARRLQIEKGWSQARIAKVFHVSQPAVSQWFTKTDQVLEGAPDKIEGLDNVARDVSAQRGRRLKARPRAHPWSRDGECLVLARKLTARIEDEITLGARSGLDLEEHDVMLTTLQDLAVVVDGLIVEMVREP